VGHLCRIDEGSKGFVDGFQNSVSYVHFYVRIEIVHKQPSGCILMRAKWKCNLFVALVAAGGTRWLAEQAAQKRRQAAALQAKRDFSLRSK
jgi:hypothetical protein